MTCGAHSGQVNFDLQKFGDVTAETSQMLCNNRGVEVTNLTFNWVNLKMNPLISMNEVKFRKISIIAFSLAD